VTAIRHYKVLQTMKQDLEALKAWRDGVNSRAEAAWTWRSR